jgi:gluconokinase
LTEQETIDGAPFGGAKALAIIVMGVCGTGKTTLGEALSQRLACPFLEGDGFHPAANVEKMRAGTPLADEDRWPWLEALGRAIGDHVRSGRTVVAACSALKRAYRDRLRRFAGHDILFILLDGDPDMLEARMTARTDHYMPATLLDSQLLILERPAADERSMSLDAAAAPERLLARVLEAISA